ncbi:MAG: polysaccharide biosynthesis tyrosine autokinase [Candidatus Eremiobacteraeota bacterium]|nr:polysaccharide biosynthesis tyrosine autokinase [Candidatus Eremiobacteraeota bacterium]MBV8354055.1 polysaccharide biosynthesis tyrosine autokinase [Candidatus Eremiobacteraeota bacterium]
MIAGQTLDMNGIPLALTGARVEEPDSQETIRSLWATFWMRRRLFVAVAVGVMSLIVVTTLMMPKKYTTTVKLIAGNPGGNTTTAAVGTTGLPILNALLAANSVQTSETYAELFQQSSVASRVIDDLHLNLSPQALLSRIKVKPVNNTTILALSVTERSPRESARLANAVAQAFVANERDLVSAQATQAINFLSKQLPIASKRLHDADIALSRFAATHPIPEADVETKGIVSADAAIDAKIAQSQLDLQQQRGLIRSLSAQLAGIPATAAGSQTTTLNPIGTQLRGQLATLQVQLQAAREQYTDKHPAVQAIKAQIAQVEGQIQRLPQTVVADRNTILNPLFQQLNGQLATARAQAASDEAQLSESRRQRAALNPKTTNLPNGAATLANLQRQEKLASAVYLAMQQKYNDAMIAKTTALSDVTITQPADASTAIVHPDLRINLAVGFALSLILGVFAVLVVDFFDNSIKDAGEVERELSVPVLANIPAMADDGHGVSTEDIYVRMEMFIQLVISMRYASDKPMRTIAITSPLKGDGKSSIAVNVGKAFGDLTVSIADHLRAVMDLRSAEQSQPLALPGATADGVSVGARPMPAEDMAPRVLLIDGDLRRPTLHSKLGLSDRPGLSDVIVGNAKLDEAIQATDFPGLDLLSSGTPSANPIKLLQSLAFDQILEQLAQQYATVIIDTPALTPAFDAAVLSTKADGTILVVSAGQTELRAAKRALQRLSHVGVRDFIGVVVNRSKESIEDYSDYLAAAPGLGVLATEAA